MDGIATRIESIRELPIELALLVLTVVVGLIWAFAMLQIARGRREFEASVAPEALLGGVGRAIVLGKSLERARNGGRKGRSEERGRPVHSLE